MRHTRTTLSLLSALGLAFGALPGCGGEKAVAEVTGEAMGISFGETSYVYFGGPFVVVTPDPMECLDISWVRLSYQDGVAPTEDDVRMLQFGFTGGDVTTGQKSIGLGASVTSTVIQVSGGAMSQTRATQGALNVDALEDEVWASGSFEGVAFEDGTLDGTFEAEWCTNLKDR